LKILINQLDSARRGPVPELSQGLAARVDHTLTTTTMDDIDRQHVVLPLEVIFLAVEMLHCELPTLRKLCLVNRALLSTASKFLYAYLKMPAVRSSARYVTERQTTRIQSALLPHYSPCVRYLKLVSQSWDRFCRS
jgi:hypothetical protein